MSQASVSIIGAGISGLTVGRVLLKKGIRATIYDSHPPPPPQRNAYGISLQPWAYRRLLPFLDMDESTFRRRASIDTARDSSTPTKNEQTPPLRAHRARVEHLLRDGLDIRWNHKVANLHISTKGIDLTFADSGLQSASTDLVIAADGVHSTVRSLFCPSTSPTILPFVVINGKRHVSPSLFSSLYDPAFVNTGPVLEARTRDSNVRLQISLNEILPDGSASLSWTFSRPPHHPTAERDPLHRPNRSPEQAKQIPDAFFDELAALQRLHAAELDSVFRETFDPETTRRDRLLHWLMRTTHVNRSELRECAKQGVLMVGDAVHAQPILGGEGANAAMEDGIDVGEWIAERGIEGLADFYGEERTEKWRRGVEASERRLEEIHREARSAL